MRPIGRYLENLEHTSASTLPSIHSLILAQIVSRLTTTTTTTLKCH